MDRSCGFWREVFYCIDQSIYKNTFSLVSSLYFSLFLFPPLLPAPSPPVHPPHRPLTSILPGTSNNHRTTSEHLATVAPSTTR